jgi:hypothetical protein
MRKRYSILLILLFLTFISKAQLSYYFQDFEQGMPPEITTIDNNNSGIAWIGINDGGWGIAAGKGHGSMSSADLDVAGLGTPDAWMIMPKLVVKKGYIFSFWAQAWDPSSIEKFSIVASKDNDSLNLAN